MKTKASVKGICEYCKVVRRKERVKIGKGKGRGFRTISRVRIVCSRNPRHKRRQG